MNIQNINDKIIMNPTQISHIEYMENFKQINNYKHLIADFITELPLSSVIGKLLDIKNSGKRVTVLILKGCIIKDLLQSFEIVEI